MARAAAAAVLACVLAPAAQARKPAPVRASPDARTAAQWVAQTRDAGGKPYAIVDKKAAQLLVFDGAHRLVGVTAVLLGSAQGDESAPDVGLHTQQGEIPPEERTTPAGRFDAFPGRNLEGEAIVWVDYAAAFAIHRLRPGHGMAGRIERLATQTPEDNRVSAGCVVVPEAFFLRVVQPVLGGAGGVVYVLPEASPLHSLFNSL